MSKRKCVVCGVDPAAGFASVGDGFYCHGDDDRTPTCYERSQHLLLPAPRADSKDPLASVERLLNETIKREEDCCAFQNPLAREAVRLLLAVAREGIHDVVSDKTYDALFAFAGSLDD